MYLDMQTLAENPYVLKVAEMLRWRRGTRLRLESRRS